MIRDFISIIIDSLEKFQALIQLKDPNSAAQAKTVRFHEFVQHNKRYSF